MEEMKKLGFGMMRLPRKGLFIDVEQVKKMVDLFMEEGFNYFDTAYVYQGSEAAVKKALVMRYPRESYLLATKLNAWMFVRNEKGAKEQFYTSLERTGAGYFDYYLLHCLMTKNYEKYDQYHIWDYVKELKEKGLVKHYGFSYHSGPELLDQILCEHPDVDFVQLQINYADWENPRVTSRANYEVARKHGKQIIVMEPVKGGDLAKPPQKVQELLKAVNPDASAASWAIRFAASLDGIFTVLSGMSNIEQVRDNTSYMKDFRPLDQEEQAAIRNAQEILGKSAHIPCTACHYCTEGCPKQIPIPEIFSAMNLRLGNGQIEEAQAAYDKLAAGGHRASDCVGCKQCENACPQGINITQRLQECAKIYEKGEKKEECL